MRTKHCILHLAAGTRSLPELSTRTAFTCAPKAGLCCRSAEVDASLCWASGLCCFSQAPRPAQAALLPQGFFFPFVFSRKLKRHPFP